MLKNKKAKRLLTKQIPTIISTDMNILGNLVSDGVVDINGRIEGNVRAREIIIRNEGRVTGDLHGDIIQIHGRVTGLVQAKDVQLFRTCHVEGTILHEALAVEDGAFVDGSFKRTDRARIAAEEAAEKTETLPLPFEPEESDASVDMLEHIRLIRN